MNGILLFSHLGLGDAVILNAIIRDLASKHELVCVPAKYANVPSVQFLLRDLSNVVIRPVEDADELAYFARNVWKGEVLNTGAMAYGFDLQHWDRSFYDQAEVPFERRWSHWKCVRDKSCERQDWPVDPFIFLHDDWDRDIRIKADQITSPIKRVVRPMPSLSKHIFEWWGVIEAADEIHCIPSCFCLWIDSIDLPKNPKLFLHAYSREGPLPTFKKDWTILK